MKLFPLRRELNNPPQNVISKTTLRAFRGVGGWRGLVVA